MDDKNIEEVFPRIFKKNFDALGTEIIVQFVVEDTDDLLLAQNDYVDIVKEYERLTKIFNRFDPNSELSKINSNLGVFQTASSEMRSIIKLSLDFYHKTQYLFDPRILENLKNIGYRNGFEKGIDVSKISEDSRNLIDRDLSEDLKIEGDAVCFNRRMDFSGIAKGFITDVVAEFLRKRNRKNFIIDSGGDIFIYGVDECENKWTVDVEGIDCRKLMFSLSNQAIATSGIGKRKWEIEGKRFHHLIDPRNPNKFNFDVKAVSVISKSTTEADVWAKTLFLIGKNNGIIYAKNHDLAAVFLAYDGSAVISAKAKEYLINNKI